MNQRPRQRWDRPFRRTAGFLGTVMVQIISRIPPTSSDSLVTITPLPSSVSRTRLNTIASRRFPMNVFSNMGGVDTDMSMHMLETAEVDIAYDVDGPLPIVSFSLSSQRRLRAAGSEP